MGYILHLCFRVIFTRNNDKELEIWNSELEARNIELDLKFPDLF